MRAATIITAFAALASARSVGKQIKRTNEGDCDPQTPGSGPTPSSDTDTAFLADTDFSTAAQGATTPDGYELGFQNLQAASQPCMGYLSYETLTSYDPATCASFCDSTDGCWGFNIYFERDPSLWPATSCPDPASTTNIKCALWGILPWL